jgi:large subunit ribosomal protein L6
MMSRIGKHPITVPEGVRVTILSDRIEFEGQKGKLSSPLFPDVQARLEGAALTLARTEENQTARARHGLCRSLANNALIGETDGYSKQMEIFGVGYRAKIDKGRLELSLGYSKPVVFEIPEGIEIVAEKPTILTVRGIDKQKVGQVANTIKRFRVPDPYKQKGVRYAGERLIKKERKAGVTGA